MTPDGGRWLQHARMPTRAGGPGMARHGRAVLQRDHRVILRAMSAANLVGMLPSELEDLAVELGASRYRGRQLATWIYRKGVVDLDAMTDLPKEFRSALAERAVAALPQVGCGYACAFCLTGTMGLARNLTAGEILGQVLRANAVEHATHLVFMGMGEPLANYAEDRKSTRLNSSHMSISYAVFC